jgi:hypothetical protein
MGDGKLMFAIRRPGSMCLADAAVIPDLSVSIAGRHSRMTAFLTVKRIPAPRKTNSISSINSSLTIEWE